MIMLSMQSRKTARHLSFRRARLLRERTASDVPPKLTEQDPAESTSQVSPTSSQAPTHVLPSHPRQSHLCTTL